MAAGTNVHKDRKYDDIILYLNNKEIQMCEKLNKPVGGEVFVCDNKENAWFHLCAV